MRYFPSKSYFSKTTERDFQIQLNKRSQRLATMVVYLMIFLLSSFILISLVTEESAENLTINVIRIVMIILAIAFIFICKKGKIEHLHSHFFAYAILVCALFNYLFWSFSQTHHALNEGGPMLVVASMIAIPMLHLGHKIILGFIIGGGLIGIHLFTPVSIIWTLYFYLAMVTVMGGIQYQLDILLRTQYRAELIEVEKATTDQLTGVYNRHSFDSKCTLLIEQLKPSQYIALAMIDIDHFKKYNDNYGHLEGDQVLAEVAKILSDCEADLVVRFGGEEFILVKILRLEELNWLDDLPNRFVVNTIPHKFSSFKRVTVSAGIAIAEYNEQRVMPKDLLLIADIAMYRAKDAGRNQIVAQIT